VIDVGAAHGDFTRTTAAVFPDAAYHLIEPLKEYDPFLRDIREGPSKTTVHQIAATEKSGEIVLNVHPDLVGSSIFREAEGPGVDGVARTVPAITLDELARDHRLASPFLIKADVQGAELRVLEGAREILPATALVILEVSFQPFFDGGPEHARVISFMESQGFVVYDVLGLSRRPLDGALAQADLVFARHDGPLRADHRFATPEQRKKLTERLKRR
jgi:FkbM family methyltransferase